MPTQAGDCGSSSAQRPDQSSDAATTGSPKLAAHEHGRKLKQKLAGSASGKSTARGALGAHKTVETNVSLQGRVDAFPDQSFTFASTPMGKKLFCRCCSKDVENILGTIKTHLNSHCEAQGQSGEMV